MHVAMSGDDENALLSFVNRMKMAVVKSRRLTTFMAVLHVVAELDDIPENILL
jgi:hypothetical protein